MPASVVPITVPQSLSAIKANTARGIYNPYAGSFYIPAEGTGVDVFADMPCDESLLAFTLIGEVSIFLLQRQGNPTLHASAVATDEGAIVFIGPAGQGKSTIAASCLRRGLPLITDDHLPISVTNGIVCGGPSVPVMKLLAGIAEDTLATVHTSGCHAFGNKKVISLDSQEQYVTTRAPLRAVYLLDRYDPASARQTDTRVTLLPPQMALNALLAQTAFGTLFIPSEVARFLPVYAKLVKQAPVRVLTYPDGFEHLNPVVDRIFEELKTS